VVGEESFEWFDLLDIGDIVGVDGTLFRTKSGELTLRVLSFAVLAKDLHPLPDKRHGLVDVEKRYRQRYVDLLVNEDVRAVFIMRSKIIAAMRRFCDERGFLECETPTMVHIAGGAAARPFRTHHNALDLELDLRIATELNLKRLIVGGLERVYEIGRIFRNEGIDTKHNPEFTMLELYAAYWSRAEMMQFNEELFAALVREAHGVDTIAYGDIRLSFARPFARISYLDALRTFGGLERGELLSFQGAKAVCKRLGIPESPSHGHALDKIFEKIVEPHLVQPTFVYDYPVIISPLAKRKADDPELVDRYELFCAHMEMSNAFTELNDPDDQRTRFEGQIAERAAGDEEIPPPDWDFVQALEYGMPPTAGIGVGVDRLVMLLTNNQSIREVILFPLQRPQAALS
jgi:lysyl-tRNA synthetase class 2